MNSMHPLVLALLIVALVVAFAPISFLALVSLRQRRNARRSPLTTHLHHLPGYQASLEAERLMGVANDWLLIATLTGPFVVMVWAFQKLDPRQIRFGGTEIFLLASIAIVAFFAARSGFKKLRERRNYLDGLLAERATAQDLTPLIAKGCAIYHDVPAEKFNLDHVVIGPCAVFMVETKSRRKPAARGAANAKVIFDGATLVFPDWRDSTMLDQARGQAPWLADYLYRKVGERINVEAVLALPGWYVTRSSQSTDVHVINPRMHNFMADTQCEIISDAQRRRIMTAIEERYPSDE